MLRAVFVLQYVVNHKLIDNLLNYLYTIFINVFCYWQFLWMIYAELKVMMLFDRHIFGEINYEKIFSMCDCAFNVCFGGDVR